MERKRRELEQRDMEERKRKRETEIEAEEKAKVDKEWQKNFEESREGRVSSWQKFQNKKTKTSKGFFKPPKNKMEQRWKRLTWLLQIFTIHFVICTSGNMVWMRLSFHLLPYLLWKKSINL